MTVDPPTINAVFSGLVLMFGALATLVTARGRRVGVQRRDYRKLQRVNVAAFGHIYTLEVALASHGLVPPARPPELDERDDDDRELPATPTLPRQPRPETRGQ